MMSAHVPNPRAPTRPTSNDEHNPSREDWGAAITSTPNRAFIITNSDDCKLLDFKTGQSYEAGEVFGTVEV